MSPAPSKLSLSTSWNASRHSNGRDIIDEIRDAGFDTVELSFALTEEIVDEILGLVDKRLIRVSSLHNMCPLPKEIERKKASPDYYSLASPDLRERGLAVSAAKRTIDYAGKFGARAVVMHAGRIETKDRTRDLASLTNEPASFEELRGRMITERGKLTKDYMANVISSFSELVPYAGKRGVALGIENRYYYREIPIIDEFEEIFKNFPFGTLHYWHDVGHAEVFERLGLVRHKDLLERYSNRLLGIHLHDIIGPINDHNPPGKGTFDFKMLRPYIKEDTIKVLEVHHPATSQDIKDGAVYLGKILDSPL